MENYPSLSVFCSELSWWRIVLGYQVFVVVGGFFCSELSWWRIVLAYQFCLFVLSIYLFIIYFSQFFVVALFLFVCLFVCFL